jgi:hypothetical protein
VLNTNHIFPPSLCRCHSDFFLKKNAYTDVHKHACILLGSGTRAPIAWVLLGKEEVVGTSRAGHHSFDARGEPPDNRAPRRT